MSYCCPGLNRITNEVGVGYLEDYATSNVWHWTAEFGVSYGAPAQAVLRSQSPAAGHSALDTEVTNYSWMWPLPLASGERFTVYLIGGERQIPIGSIAQPVYGSRYVLSADVQKALASLNTGDTQLVYDWQVRLENGTVPAQ